MSVSNQNYLHKMLAERGAKRHASTRRKGMSIDSERGDATRGSWLMANIIAEHCPRTMDTTCVDLCPVDCIHPAKGRTNEDGRPTFDQVPLFCIDPTVWIDCGACVP